MSGKKEKPISKPSESLLGVIADELLKYAQLYRDTQHQPAPISAETTRAYADALRDCSDLAMLHEAMHLAQRRSPVFFPSAGRIWEEYENLRGKQTTSFCRQCEGDGYLLILTADKKSHRLEKCPFCSGGVGEKRENS